MRKQKPASFAAGYSGKNPAIRLRVAIRVSTPRFSAMAWDGVVVWTWYARFPARKNEKSRLWHEDIGVLRRAEGFIHAFAEFRAVEHRCFAQLFALVIGQFAEVAAFIRAAAFVFGPALRALNEQDMAVFVGAINVVVAGLAALVAVRNNGIADTFAETLVEHEIFTDKLVAQTSCFHLPGVFDDAAFELEHVLETPVTHISAGFFATYATGAVHDDFFVALVGQEVGYER